MWLHIRGVGEWTNRLYNYFEKEQEKLHNVEEDLAANIVNKKLINGNSDATPMIKLPGSVLIFTSINTTLKRYYIYFLHLFFNVIQ